ncbi:MAG: carboxypeptidase regulatory-like domain-containing protein [Acidobacteriia bacterium]|nr:carboxypeptidase regulatory-like domain-containing protein [Terriglobia bacterium]
MTRAVKFSMGMSLALILFLAAGSPAFGQASSGTASISGAVTDPSGAVMPGVEVEVRNIGTNAVRNLQSNDVGRWEAVGLQPGDYEILASKQGFASLLRKGITVSVGERAVVDLALQVSATATTLTVDAATAVVETDKTDVSTVVNLKDVMNLPMNGRRWDSFTLSTPGVSNDGGYGLLSFRGMSGLYNNNMIDGMDNNQAFFSEAKGRTRLSYGISTEAIQEFQVGTSAFSAQYGRSAGGVVNAVTKSGTNEMHGGFFYLMRDDSLNAANPYSGPQLINLGYPPIPKDRRQQFGPYAGGAVKKDKLFYFLSYDQQKRTFPATIVPYSTSFLTGTGTAPGYSNAQAFFQGMVGLQAREGNQQVGLARVDWNATARNQFSSTVNILRWDSPNGIQTAPTHGYDASANGSDVVKAETVIGRWNAMVSPTFFSDLRGQWGRDFESQLPNGPGPYVGVTNGFNFGMPNFLPRAAYPDEKRWQVSQNLNWLHGRHTLKFGYDVTGVHDQMINLYRGGGEYSYSTLNDFALDCGNPAFPLPLQNCQASATVPSGRIVGKNYSNFYQAFDTLGAGGTTEFNTIDLAFYIEDTFRPVPSVTLNLGLRYDLQKMPGLNGNPDIALTNVLNTDKNNFGPRIGLSWDPSGKQKTVVRLGGGVYYGRTQNSTLVNLMTNNGTRFKSYSFIPSSAGSPVFPNVLPAVPSGSGAKSDVVFATSDFAQPLIYQAQFSVEQEIFHNFTLSAVYMLNRGTRLPVFVDTNLYPSTQTATYTVCGSPQVGSSTACANPASTFTVPFWSGARPNTNYGYMTAVESVVNTWYNGLVIQAKKRFSKGFQLQAGFTWSKAQDDDQNSTTFTASNTPMNSFDLKNDYSLSDFDQRRRFSLSGVWQLPTGNIQSKPLRRIVHGFQLSGILTLADGRPYSGTTSGNPSPAGILGGLLGVGGSSRVPFVGRNTMTNPGVANADARLAREIKFSERMRLQLIFEAFNVTNRVQITGINTTQYNVRTLTLFPRTDFQQVSGAGTNLFGPRQLQLGARFSF